MVIVTIIQSIMYFRVGYAEAKRLGIPNRDIKSAIRFSAITVVGPTVSTIIALLSLIAVIGGPMGWMRVNDIGAPRSELAVIALIKSVIPPGSSELTIFSYAAWAMALNNMGWMIMALVFTPRMDKINEYLEKTFDKKLTLYVMEGSNLDLFSFLVASGVVRKPSPALVSTVVAAITMFVIFRWAKNSRILRELSFGLAMITGMAAATAVHYALL